MHIVNDAEKNVLKNAGTVVDALMYQVKNEGKIDFIPLYISYFQGYWEACSQLHPKIKILLDGMLKNFMEEILTYTDDEKAKEIFEKNLEVLSYLNDEQ